MNSYQKRKQEIEYYLQRCLHLEEAIKSILATVKSSDIEDRFETYFLLTEIISAMNLSSKPPFERIP